MTRNEKSVLILTHSRDQYTVPRVAAEITRRGARALRFDTDLFPTERKISARFGDRARHAFEANLCETDVEIDRRSAERDVGARVSNANSVSLAPDEITAVWSRKVWTPTMDASLDARLKEGCVRESYAALYGFFDTLQHARWVNDMTAMNEAENKLRQLRIAEEVGLRVPKTLVTNDPDAARAFHAEHAPLVAKMLTPLTISMGEAPMFVHTSPVRSEDLEHLDGLRHSPMVFQETIEKRLELRIAFVAGRMFAGAIDARGSEHGRTDWRLSRPGEVRWTRGEVPRELAERLIALMDRLRLVYGAIDVIETPEGDHVFLEVNPGGEWGMLERDLGLPIAAALADALLEPVETNS